MHAHRQWAARVAGALGLAIVGTVGVPNGAGAAAKNSWAVVDAHGGLVRGRGAVSAAQIGTGRYEVVFKGSVAKCAFEATAGDPTIGAVDEPIAVTVAQRTSNAQGVFLTTVDQHTGALVDAPFHLATYCGALQSYAVVGSDGAVARGKHVLSAFRQQTGTYQVIFDHDVSQCTFTATAGSVSNGLTTSPSELTVAGLILRKNGVFVKSISRTGAAVDGSFHLAVDCARKSIGAVVTAAGATVRGDHVVSSRSIGRGTGSYEVIFDRKMTKCAYTATVGVPTNGGVILDPVLINTATRGTTDYGVYVNVTNVDTLAQDEPFHLHVSC